MASQLWPRSLRVFAAPQAVFSEAAQGSGGLGTLAFWLSIECCLRFLGSIVSTLLRLTGAPLVALQSLWAIGVRYAIGPVFIVLVAAVGVYFLTRRTPHAVDIFNAAAALSYAWIPHTLIVACGAILAAFDCSTDLLPPSGYPPEADIIRWAARAGLEYGPTAALGVLCIHTLGHPAQVGDKAAVAPARGAIAMLILLSSGGAGAIWNVHAHWAQVRPLMAGDIFPAINLKGLNHPDVDVAALRGQVVLVDFWASWCGPCVAAMPHLQALHSKLAGEGFTLLAVNIEPDNVAGVQRFLASERLTIPVFLDDGALQERLHVHVYPTSFLIDPSGVVQAIYNGPASSEVLENKIRALLKGET